MALQTILISESTETQVDLSTTDDLLIGPGAALAFGGAGYAVFGAGSSHWVNVQGAIFGLGSGVRLGDDATLDANNDLTVGASGSIDAESFAVAISGRNSTVINHGAISGGNIGLYLNGDGGSGSVFTNTGTLFGNTALRHDRTGALLVENTGSIIAVSAAILTTGEAIDSVRNDGIIVGAVQLGLGNDRLVNRGLVDGAVSMEAGDDFVRVIGRMMDVISLGNGVDSYNGRGSIVQDISLFGGADGDRFVLGEAREDIRGDGGLDTVSLLGSGQGTVLYLDNRAANTGMARGDTFDSVESAIMTNLADAVYANVDNNLLFGMNGADLLSGGSGNDTLVGGLGRDTLTGGAESDRFMFNTTSEVLDTITDFANTGPQEDEIGIVASAFGGGLVAGQVLTGRQFITRTDGVAQDSSDRFIFRTTDQTLWFDANGNVPGASLLVADLQAGAVVTAADIVLV